MAQTLNPTASVFRPMFMEDMNFDIESYLPDRLLVSPNNKRQYRSFKPVQFCRSPREYTSYHHSELPYHDRFGTEYDNVNENWEDYSVTNLKQEFLKMERELGRAPRHTQNSKPYNYESNKYKPYHQPAHHPSKHMVRHNYQHQRVAPKKMAPRLQVQQQQRRTPPKMSRHQKSGQVLPKYDVECLLHLVRSQLEFYFSDQNLFEEMHSNLQYYMKLDPERWVPVHVLLDLPSVAKLTSEKGVVLQALRSSTLLELNADESKCRRPNYVAPADYKVRKNLRRSVLVYGLPEQMTDEEIRRLLDTHGNILCVAFAGMDEGPDPEIGSVIMKKKFNDVDIENLKTAFVVFESQSQANKCVKARSRHSVDGIRTMHKYDYNKVVKRLGKGQSPMMTPVPASNSFAPKPLNGMNNHGVFQQNTNAKNFQVNSSSNNGNKRMPLHHQTSNATPKVQAPVFMKHNHNNNNNLKNNSKQQGFRKPNSQKWRSPNKGSDSLNWRVNNSPMRQRSNSTQNRSTSMTSGGEFSSQFNRFSKENLNTYSVLNTHAL